MTTDASFRASNTPLDPSRTPADTSLETVSTADNALQASAANSLLASPNTLMLNDLLNDKDTPWQVHNCKIIDKSVTQEQLLPFIYHYDALSDELK